jgi:flagellar hook-basal body complex protein FliE
MAFMPDLARGNEMAIEGISALGAVGTQFEAGASRSTSAAASSAETSFTQALSQAANNAIGTMQAGESAAIQGVQGSMQPFKVVEAVMDAQRTLQQTLAIRDKLVSAYQEISRMAI